MEVGGEVESGVDEEDPGSLAHRHLQRGVADECPSCPVEPHEGRGRGGDRLSIQLDDAGGRYGCVVLGLDDVPLVLYWCQGCLRIDQDPPEHTVGYVRRHVPVGAVVHEETRVQEAGLDGARLPRSHGGGFGPSALSGDSVEVDVVWMGVLGAVGDGETKYVTDSRSDNRPRCPHGASVGTVDEAVTPCLEFDTTLGVDIRWASLGDLEVDIDDGRGRAGRRWWNVGRYRHVDLVCRSRCQVDSGDEIREDTVIRGRRAGRRDAGEEGVDLVGD